MSNQQGQQTLQINEKEPAANNSQLMEPKFCALMRNCIDNEDNGSNTSIKKSRKAE